MDPYAAKAEEWEGEDVVVTRANAPELKGKLSGHDEHGLTVTSPHEDAEYAQETFVAYRDIRGLCRATMDYGLVGH
ncbi:MAG TPA: hypothetical protein VLA04_00765 [Verrucomicrobiae bacterium]|nr:hypothetical protein [Verrucomicrobiae bacterium]